MPNISPVKTVLFEKFLVSVGCSVRMSCGNNGDHKFYNRPDLKRPITVITSKKEIPGFHIRPYLKVLGISYEEYLEILKKL